MAQEKFAIDSFTAVQKETNSIENSSNFESPELESYLSTDIQPIDTDKIKTDNDFGEAAQNLNQTASIIQDSYESSLSKEDAAKVGLSKLEAQAKANNIDSKALKAEAEKEEEGESVIWKGLDLLSRPYYALQGLTTGIFAYQDDMFDAELTNPVAADIPVISTFINVLRNPGAAIDRAEQGFVMGLTGEEDEEGHQLINDAGVVAALVQGDTDTSDWLPTTKILATILPMVVFGYADPVMHGFSALAHSEFTTASFLRRNRSARKAVGSNFTQHEDFTTVVANSISKGLNFSNEWVNNITTSIYDLGITPADVFTGSKGAELNTKALNKIISHANQKYNANINVYLNEAMASLADNSSRLLGSISEMVANRDFDALYGLDAMQVLIRDMEDLTLANKIAENKGFSPHDKDKLIDRFSNAWNQAVEADTPVALSFRGRVLTSTMNKIVKIAENGSSISGFEFIKGLLSADDGVRLMVSTPEVTHFIGNLISTGVVSPTVFFDTLFEGRAAANTDIKESLEQLEKLKEKIELSAKAEITKSIEENSGFLKIDEQAVKEARDFAKMNSEEIAEGGDITEAKIKSEFTQKLAGLDIVNQAVKDFHSANPKLNIIDDFTEKERVEKLSPFIDAVIDNKRNAISEITESIFGKPAFTTAQAKAKALSTVQNEGFVSNLSAMGIDESVAEQIKTNASAIVSEQDLNNAPEMLSEDIFTSALQGKWDSEIERINTEHAINLKNKSALKDSDIEGAISYADIDKSNSEIIDLKKQQRLLNKQSSEYSERIHELNLAIEDAAENGYEDAIRSYEDEIEKLELSREGIDDEIDGISEKIDEIRAEISDAQVAAIEEIELPEYDEWVQTLDKDEIKNIKKQADTIAHKFVFTEPEIQLKFGISNKEFDSLVDALSHKHDERSLKEFFEGTGAELPKSGNFAVKWNLSGEKAANAIDKLSTIKIELDSATMGANPIVKGERINRNVVNQLAEKVMRKPSANSTLNRLSSFKDGSAGFSADAFKNDTNKVAISEERQKIYNEYLNKSSRTTDEIISNTTTTNSISNKLGIDLDNPTESAMKKINKLDEEIGARESLGRLQNAINPLTNLPYEEVIQKGTSRNFFATNGFKQVAEVGIHPFYDALNKINIKEFNEMTIGKREKTIRKEFEKALDRAYTKGELNLSPNRDVYTAFLDAQLTNNPELLSNFATEFGTLKKAYKNGGIESEINQIIQVTDDGLNAQEKNAAIDLSRVESSGQQVWHKGFKLDQIKSELDQLKELSATSELYKNSSTATLQGMANFLSDISSASVLNKGRIVELTDKIKDIESGAIEVSENLGIILNKDFGANLAKDIRDLAKQIKVNLINDAADNLDVLVSKFMPNGGLNNKLIGETYKQELADTLNKRKGSKNKPIDKILKDILKITEEVASEASVGLNTNIDNYVGGENSEIFKDLKAALSGIQTEITAANKALETAKDLEKTIPEFKNLDRKVKQIPNLSKLKQTVVSNEIKSETIRNIISNYVQDQIMSGVRVVIPNKEEMDAIQLFGTLGNVNLSQAKTLKAIAESTEKTDAELLKMVNNYDRSNTKKVADQLGIKSNIERSTTFKSDLNEKINIILKAMDAGEQSMDSVIDLMNSLTDNFLVYGVDPNAAVRKVRNFVDGTITGVYTKNGITEVPMQDILNNLPASGQMTINNFKQELIKSRKDYGKALAGKSIKKVGKLELTDELRSAFEKAFLAPSKGDKAILAQNIARFEEFVFANDKSIPWMVRESQIQNMFNNGAFVFDNLGMLHIDDKIAREMGAVSTADRQSQLVDEANQEVEKISGNFKERTGLALDPELLFGDTFITNGLTQGAYGELLIKETLKSFNTEDKLAMYQARLDRINFADAKKYLVETREAGKSIEVAKTWPELAKKSEKLYKEGNLMGDLKAAGILSQEDIDFLKTYGWEDTPAKSAAKYAKDRVVGVVGQTTKGNITTNNAGVKLEQLPQLYQEYVKGKVIELSELVKEVDIKKIPKKAVVKQGTVEYFVHELNKIKESPEQYMKVLDNGELDTKFVAKEGVKSSGVINSIMAALNRAVKTGQIKVQSPEELLGKLESFVHEIWASGSDDISKVLTQNKLSALSKETEEKIAERLTKGEREVFKNLLDNAKIDIIDTVERIDSAASELASRILDRTLDTSKLRPENITKGGFSPKEASMAILLKNSEISNEYNKVVKKLTEAQDKYNKHDNFLNYLINGKIEMHPELAKITNDRELVAKNLSEVETKFANQKAHLAATQKELIANQNLKDGIEKVGPNTTKVAKDIRKTVGTIGDLRSTIYDFEENIIPKIASNKIEGDFKDSLIDLQNYVDLSNTSVPKIMYLGEDTVRKIKAIADLTDGATRVKIKGIKDLQSVEDVEVEILKSVGLWNNQFQWRTDPKNMMRAIKMIAKNNLVNLDRAFSLYNSSNPQVKNTLSNIEKVIKGGLTNQERVKLVNIEGGIQSARNSMNSALRTGHDYAKYFDTYGTKIESLDAANNYVKELKNKKSKLERSLKGKLSKLKLDPLTARPEDLTTAEKEFADSLNLIIKNQHSHMSDVKKLIHDTSNMIEGYRNDKKILDEQYNKLTKVVNRQIKQADSLEQGSMSGLAYKRAKEDELAKITKSAKSQKANKNLQLIAKKLDLNSKTGRESLYKQISGADRFDYIEMLVNKLNSSVGRRHLNATNPLDRLLDFKEIKGNIMSDIDPFTYGVQFAIKEGSKDSVANRFRKELMLMKTGIKDKQEVMHAIPLINDRAIAGLEQAFQIGTAGVLGVDEKVKNIASEISSTLQFHKNRIIQEAYKNHVPGDKIAEIQEIFARSNSDFSTSQFDDAKTYATHQVNDKAIRDKALAEHGVTPDFVDPIDNPKTKLGQYAVEYNRKVARSGSSGAKTKPRSIVGGLSDINQSLGRLDMGLKYDPYDPRVQFMEIDPFISNSKLMSNIAISGEFVAELANLFLGGAVKHANELGENAGKYFTEVRAMDLFGKLHEFAAGDIVLGHINNGYNLDLLSEFKKGDDADYNKIISMLNEDEQAASNSISKSLSNLIKDVFERNGDKLTSTSTLHIPKALNNIIFTSANDIAEGLKTTMQAYNQFMGYWKSAMLFTPGFHLKNMTGNYFMTLAVNPKSAPFINRNGSAVLGATDKIKEITDRLAREMISGKRTQTIRSNDIKKQAGFVNNMEGGKIAGSYKLSNGEIVNVNSDKGLRRALLDELVVNEENYKHASITNLGGVNSTRTYVSPADAYLYYLDQANINIKSSFTNLVTEQYGKQLPYMSSKGMQEARAGIYDLQKVKKSNPEIYKAMLEANGIKHDNIDGISKHVGNANLAASRDITNVTKAGQNIILQNWEMDLLEHYMNTGFDTSTDLNTIQRNIYNQMQKGKSKGKVKSLLNYNEILEGMTEAELSRWNRIKEYSMNREFGYGSRSSLIKDMYFDTSDDRNFNNKVMGQIFPFWGFMRKSIMISLRRIKNLDFRALYGLQRTITSLMTSQQIGNNEVSEWARQEQYIPIKMENGNILELKWGNPTNTLSKYFVSDKPVLQELASSANPFIKFLVSEMSGRTDLFFGGQYDGIVDEAVDIFSPAQIRNIKKSIQYENDNKAIPLGELSEEEQLDSRYVRGSLATTLPGIFKEEVPENLKIAAINNASKIYSTELNKLKNKQGYLVDRENYIPSVPDYVPYVWDVYDSQIDWFGGNDVSPWYVATPRRQSKDILGFDDIEYYY